jgi:hypothetical protein
MRKSFIAARETLLWVALIAACGGMLYIVSQSGHLPARTDIASHSNNLAEATQLATVRDICSQGVVRSKDGNTDDLGMLSTSGIRNNAASTEGMDRLGGVEMPFKPYDETTSVAPKTPNDPAALCAALRDALNGGRVIDPAAIRTQLVILGADAAPAISSLLWCGHDRTEIEAARLLFQISNPEGLASALGKLLTMPHDSLTYGLLLAAFSDNRSQAVAHWLTDVLGKTQDAEMREQLLDLLYVMRGPEIVTALEQSALNPADNLHAQDAIDALSMRHDPAETDSLAALLLSDNTAIREAAALGLAGIGSGDAGHILADASEYTAGCAAALASISSPYAQETLLALATDSRQSVVVRTSAILSLAKQPGYRVHTILANAVIQEHDSAVISAMQKALLTTADIEPKNNNALFGSEPAGELWF